VDVCLFPELGHDKAHRVAYKRRNLDAQLGLFSLTAEYDEQFEADPDQLTLMES
jgi:hypothetical protein